MTSPPTFGRSRAAAPEPARQLVTPRDLPALGICYHVNHLRRMWTAGTFPAPFHLSPRRIAWPKKQIDDWISAKASEQSQTPNGEAK